MCTVVGSCCCSCCCCCPGCCCSGCVVGCVASCVAFLCYGGHHDIGCFFLVLIVVAGSRGLLWALLALLACESASVVLRVTVGIWLWFREVSRRRCRSSMSIVLQVAVGFWLCFAFCFTRRQGADVLYLSLFSCRASLLCRTSRNTLVRTMLSSSMSMDIDVVGSSR